MKLGDLCGAETERLTAADDLMIDYIDISSVSNESKSIIGKQTLQSRVAPSRAQRVIKADDILVSTVRPNLNAVAVYDGSFENLAVASTGFCVLRCKPGVSHRFVFNICKSNAFIKAMTEQATGASYPAVNDRIIRAFEVPDLDYESQTRLAGKLDSIQLIIDLRKQQLRELDDLIKARFVEMFGEYQDTVQLSDVAEVTGGLTKNGNRDRLPFKMPYLRVANVSFASIDTTEMFSIGLTEEERLKTTLQYGDLLFVEGNGSPDQIGRVAIWRDEVVPCVHQNHIIKARLNESKMLPAFAMHYFMSQKGRDQIKKKAVSTSGLYTLSVSKISGFVMPCPPISKQSEFAVLVGQVDKSKLSIQASLDQLETLKQSLMQKYFG